MLYHLLSHITQHFHASLISYANILTSYTPLTVAKTSLSNRLLLLTDVALIFVTFKLQHNYPLSPPIIFYQAPSFVHRIVPLVHTLLTASQVRDFVACSTLRDGGGKSFSKKTCEKRAEAGERPRPLSQVVRVLFSLCSF